MYNTRHFPAAAGDRPDVFELVRAGGYDRDVTEIWEGSAELRLYDDTLEDLQAIAPREMLRGYRFSFGYTVDGVEVVAQHRQEALRMKHVRIEHDGRAVEGTLDGEVIRADGLELRIERRPALAVTGHAEQDPRHPPDLPLARGGIQDGAHAERALVLHEAAVVAVGSSRPGRAAARVPVPQLRGRGRGRDRAPLPPGRSSTRRSTTSAATRSPTTGASTTSATPTAARCCASRARTGSARSAR